MSEENLESEPSQTRKPFAELEANCSIELTVADDEPTLAPRQDPYLSKIIDGKYQLIRRIGGNSNTVVFEAKQIKGIQTEVNQAEINQAEVNQAEVNQTVAVKILRAEFNSAGLINRFKQECKILSLLKHKNIVSYLGSGTTADGEPYFAMEYVNGPSLKEILESDEPLSYRRVLEIFIQTCAALSVAHEKGVVHRDLKPANIMLTKDSHGKETVKVLDFGVSKLLAFQGETFQTKTQTGEMLGSILYMSPEQCLDQDLDGRSDIYSLGCVLFEILTGVPPLAARTAFETMNKHMTQKPQSLRLIRPDLDFPEELNLVVQKCLEKKPSDRFGDVSALEAELIDLLKKAPDKFANPRKVRQENPLETDSVSIDSDSSEDIHTEAARPYTIAELSPQRIHARRMMQRLQSKNPPNYSAAFTAIMICLAFSAGCLTLSMNPYFSSLAAAQLDWIRFTLCVAFPIIFLFSCFALWRRRKTD